MDAQLYAKFFEVEDWYWWSVGTRAIFRDWIAGAVGQNGAARLLDLGCGSGALTSELGAFGRVVGVDLSADAIAFTRRRGLRLLCVGGAETLPFVSGSFDAVAAADIVEHTDDRRTLAEVARVLRPGGVALVHVPAFPVLWGEHDEVNHHRRRYRKAPLRRLIEASGLRIIRLSYVNTLLFPGVLAARLAKRALRATRPARPPRPEIFDLPPWLNGALRGVLALERHALRHLDLPVGVSLLCLARKPSEADGSGSRGAR